MKVLSRRGFRPAQALPTLAIAIGAIMASADSHAAGMFFYKFTPIADSGPGFPYTGIAPFPSINSSGRIAFGATLTGGNEGVFTRLGTGPVETLLDAGTSGYSSFGLETSINSLSMVSFTALKTTSGGSTRSILRGQNFSATPLIAESSDLSAFCGIQINNFGRVAFRAKRKDGTQEIRTQGEGVLTGVKRIIVHEGTGVSDYSQLGCAPSIAHDDTVAFTATRFGRRAIYSIDAAGVETRWIDNSSTFDFFNEIALNAQGGLAFTSSLQGGGEGVYHLNGGFLAKLMDTYGNFEGRPVNVALNEHGTVVYERSREANGSSVYVGPGQVFGRIIGFGNLMFNRMVHDVHISRGAINSTGQVAVQIQFFGGSTMVARGEPVRLIDTTHYTGGLVLSSETDGGVNVGTTFPTPPKDALLTFDLTFFSPDGQLDVTLGGKVVQSIAASEVGVRKLVSVPLDPELVKGGMQFVLQGKGASAQVANVILPGLSSKPLDLEAFSNWKVDESGGGIADAVNVARYPVAVQVTKAAFQDPKKRGITLLNAAVLSDEGVDATADLVLSSLRLAGTAPRTRTDKAGLGEPDCIVTEVNGDKLNDLVCAVELTDAVIKSGALPLEALTQSGWSIEGAGAFGGATKLR